MNKCISCPYFNISLWTLSCDVGSSGIISFEAFKTYHFFSIVERFGPMWTPMSLAHVSRLGCRRMNRRANMMNIRVFFVGFFFLKMEKNHSKFNTFAFVGPKIMKRSLGTPPCRGLSNDTKSTTRDPTIQES